MSLGLGTGMTISYFNLRRSFGLRLTVLGRVVTLYQIVHDALHARSGQEQGPLKLQCIRTERETIMGWVSFVVFPV